MNPKLKRLWYIESPEGQGGGGTGSEGEKPAEKTLTQSEVNAIAAREKNEGKQAAAREIAEQLGVSVEDAKAIIQRSLDADNAKKSDADKDREAAQKEKDAAAADRLAAKNEVHEARLERAFAKAGLDLESDDEKSKRLLRLVTVETGASYEDVLADVNKLKTDFPALFGGSTEEEGKEKSPKAPSGDPKGAPPKPKAGEDKFAAGAERAKQRAGRFAQKPISQQ